MKKEEIGIESWLSFNHEIIPVPIFSGVQINAGVNYQSGWLGNQTTVLTFLEEHPRRPKSMSKFYYNNDISIEEDD